MRLIAFGVATAGVAAAGLLATAGRDLRSGLRLEAAEQSVPAAKPASPDATSVRVDAPGTAVNVDKERGKVSVTAPHTDVQVDPDKGRVQVRAPYVNLDIRW
jgi:ferric-dicitrate binding protein FerR (iron transport regulator)